MVGGFFFPPSSSPLFLTNKAVHDMAHVRRRLVADNGMGGQGSRSGGKNGEDLVLRVPLGTLVRELQKYHLI